MDHRCAYKLVGVQTVAEPRPKVWKLQRIKAGFGALGESLSFLIQKARPLEPAPGPPPRH